VLRLSKSLRFCAHFCPRICRPVLKRRAERRSGFKRLSHALRNFSLFFLDARFVEFVALRDHEIQEPSDSSNGSVRDSVQVQGHLACFRQERHLIPVPQVGGSLPKDRCSAKRLMKDANPAAAAVRKREQYRHLMRAAVWYAPLWSGLVHQVGSCVFRKPADDACCEQPVGKRWVCR
jgi:hypothetical protein